MITRFISWVRDWIKNMIKKSDIKDNLNCDVTISQEMVTALETWVKMYKNESPWLSPKIKSLNLPAAIATEIARATTLEMEIMFSETPRAKFLKEQFDNVMPKLRTQIEYGVAKGGLIFKPYVDGKNILVDFVQADQFYPVSYDSNGMITACVFADQKIRGKDFFTRLEYHRLTEKGLEVINAAYKSNTKNNLGTKVPLSAVDEWSTLEEFTKIGGIDRPLYAYFKYPITNNIDTGSPLGVSCYSRAVDLIKEADIIWSNLLWEMESGERALYVDKIALGNDDDGKPVLPLKRLYRQLDMGGAGDNLFKDWSPTIREENILNALNAVIKKIEFSCGLAYGTLSDPSLIAKTATEIMAGKQRSAVTVVDTQKAIQRALDDLFYAMDAWATLAKLAPAGKYEVTYRFDDSLVVDSATQWTMDLQLVAAAIMSPVEFRVRNLKESEAEATKRVAMARSSTPSQPYDDTEE